MSDLRIYAVQMTAGDVPEANLKSIFQVLEALPRQDQLAMVSFPENCLYLRLGEMARIPWMGPSDEVFQQLAKVAQAKNLHIHLGSVPLDEDGLKSNATIWIDPKALVHVVYRKMHLFDIQLTDGTRMMESEHFSHGTEPAHLQVGDWRIGLTICYDLRFAELFYQYAGAECDLLLVPAAFLVPTGKAHWEVLLRARAIESQAYVVAAAQAGVHRNAAGAERRTYGHSLVVHPWGNILAQGSEAHPEVLETVLKKEEIALVRRQIPMKHHRRPVVPPRVHIIA